MAHKNEEVTSEASAPICRSVSHDDIEKRAYERYCDRGCAPGGDFDDWLAAERELLSERADVPGAESSISSRQPQGGAIAVAQPD